MSTVQMNAAGIGGTINLPFTGTVVVPSTNVITVDARDAAALLAAGANYVNTPTRQQTWSAPIAGTVGRIVASAALSNGTKSIANQPDVPRLCSVRVDPGTSAITAGNIAVNYLANDGNTVTDNFSCIGPGTAVMSNNLSRGTVHVNSVIVTDIAGGASPQMQIDTLNALAAIVDSGFAGFNVLLATVDNTAETPTAVNSSSASYVPTSVPNGTHNFGATYTYNAPLS